MSNAVLKFVLIACASAAVAAHASAALAQDKPAAVQVVHRSASDDSLASAGRSAPLTPLTPLTPLAPLTRAAVGKPSVAALSTSPGTASSDEERTPLGTILATLVLMAVIAVRRHRSGKS